MHLNLWIGNPMIQVRRRRRRFLETEPVTKLPEFGGEASELTSQVLLHGTIT